MFLNIISQHLCWQPINNYEEMDDAPAIVVNKLTLPELADMVQQFKKLELYNRLVPKLN
jgi:hypothetical protein